MDRAELVFLGTGASGGTAGAGRSRRLESSLLVRDAGGHRILIDLTRHFPRQSAAVDRVDLLLLTHAHRDASGGIPALRRWVAAAGAGPISAFAHPATIARLRERYRRLDHLDLHRIDPGERLEHPGWTVTGVLVPHAADPARFPTYAWRLEHRGRVLVYASDVGGLTADLAALACGADVLVLDAAMWHRPLFSHLQADVALPVVCGWPVDRILLTQIGSTAPPHGALVEAAARLCPRASPAYDGLVTTLGTRPRRRRS